MFNLKKGLCIMMSTVMLMGTTASASGSIVDKVPGSDVVTSDTSYIKNYKKINGISNSSILGADFSHYQQNLEWKKVYYDYKGNKCNIFSFVKEQGVNTVSVKVAVNPQGEFSYLSLANAVKTIKEANAAGLNTNMILMYSDGITYANAQTLPQGWTADNAAVKAEEYTKELLNKLETEKALPTMMTIGNELDYNFLGLTANDSWDGWVAMGKISQLMKAKGLKVAVGIAPIVDPTGIQWVLQKLDTPTAGIYYDYVGVSLYPDSNTNTYMETMRTTFSTYAKDKQLFVAGVKYPRVSDVDTTVGNESQADSIYKLLESTIDDKNAGGLIYNEAVFVGSWNSFFDGNGNAQTSFAIFGYAQGIEVDVDTYMNPYQYGLDTGLKDQKVNIDKITDMSQNAIRGMDIGSYIALRDAGVKFYNYEGKEESLIKILADNGINYMRIRIWNDPYNKDGQPYGGGNSDVETGLKLAREANRYGMKISLCFHYSDFWADPAQQIAPKAWKKDLNNTDKMCENIYQFTKDTIQQFVDAGADIGMVQIGNEITNGMLETIIPRDSGGTYKAVWGNKEKSTKLNKYLNAGSKAAREVTPDALVALHLETPNLQKYTDIMNTWERDNVDYDILGSSWYPYWSTKENANTKDTLKAIQKLSADKGKLFAVLETAWLNNVNDGDGTPNSVGEENDLKAYDVGPQGQADCLTDLYSIVMSQDNGLGAFYWEAAWIPVVPGWANWEENKKIADEKGTGWASVGALGYCDDSKMYYWGTPAWGGSSWDNNALFDINGNALQSLKFYKDSIGSDSEQVSVVKFVDNNGKEIRPAKFAKVYLGSSRNVSIPKVDGYVLQSPASSIKVTGEVDGVKTYTVKYTKVQNITFKKSAYSMTYGQSLDLAKEITLAATGTKKFSSSNAKVVSIDAKTGKMTAKAVGTATITVSVDKTAYSTAATKTIKVTVTPKAVQITSKKNDYKMTYGGSLELAKELTFSQKSTATYSSSNSKVVAIDAKTGKMTAKGTGKAMITVSVAKTATTAAATKKINVTVAPKVVVKNKGVQNFTAGKTYKMSSYMTVSGKSTTKFSSSNTSIATVGKDGTIKAVKAGKVTITAKVTAAGVAGTIEKKITVYVVPKQQTITKVSGSSKAVTVTYKKDATVSGYEVMVATNNKFTSGKKSVLVNSNKTTKTKVSKLTGKKQYYVRVRSYKVISNKKYYGSWSKAKVVKTK